MLRREVGVACRHRHAGMSKDLKSLGASASHHVPRSEVMPAVVEAEVFDPSGLYSILKGHPNAAPIHPRMPVILDPDGEEFWLGPGCVAPIKVLPCQRPFPSERMEAIPVSSLVSSPDNEGPELIEPALA